MTNITMIIMTGLVTAIQVALRAMAMVVQVTGAARVMATVDRDTVAAGDTVEVRVMKVARAMVVGRNTVVLQGMALARDMKAAQVTAEGRVTVVLQGMVPVRVTKVARDMAAGRATVVPQGMEVHQAMVAHPHTVHREVTRERPKSGS